MECIFDDLEDRDVRYENEDGDLFYVTQALIAPYWYGVKCYEAITHRDYWLRSPRRSLKAAALDDLDRLAWANDWKEVIS